MQPILYRLFSFLPTRLQVLAIYLASPKVSMGVSAIVKDAQGQVLLVHHTYRHPAWGFPSGMVGRDEQPHAALARELREELGLEAIIGPLLHADVSTRRRHLTLYYGVTLQDEPRHGHETDAHRYVGIDELLPSYGLVESAWLQA